MSNLTRTHKKLVNTKIHIENSNLKHTHMGYNKGSFKNIGSSNLDYFFKTLSVLAITVLALVIVFVFANVFLALLAVIASMFMSLIYVIGIIGIIAIIAKVFIGS